MKVELLALWCSEELTHVRKEGQLHKPSEKQLLVLVSLGSAIRSPPNILKMYHSAVRGIVYKQMERFPNI